MSQTHALPVLSDYVTLRDVARELGESYYVAYSLGASGLLGEPLVIGRQYFFPRVNAQQAIDRRRAQRPRRAERRLLTEVE